MSMYVMREQAAGHHDRLRHPLRRGNAGLVQRDLGNYAGDLSSESSPFRVTL